MQNKYLIPILLILNLFSTSFSIAGEKVAVPAKMELIQISENGKGFVYSGSNKKYFPWGFNYIGDFGRIAEDYWEEDWGRIEKDFIQMRNLGANVVRLHLQLGTYLKSPEEIDQTQIKLLQKILDLGQKHGIYLKLTGLCCFRLKDVPGWLDELSEEDRWNVQARFWEAIAKACANHPAVFCYDLMNEPIVGKYKEGEHLWLTGELGGFYFVQRICNKPGKRNRKKIAAAWIEKMVLAIKKQDQQHLVTIGVIPFALPFPKAKPFFYSPEALKHLDFVSVHFYPRKDEVDKAVTALKVYDLGKPLVIGEVFPMRCSIEELDEFINKTDDVADGWIAHYFGRTIQEHEEGAEPAGELSARFFEYWKEKGDSLKAD